MRTAARLLIAASIAGVALQIAVLAWPGLPATHDGFYHHGWIETFNHAFHAEGVYARWYAEAFGGAGSPSFVFYPPLLRLLSLPFGLVSDAGSILTRGAVSTVLVLNAIAAWAAMRSLPIAPRARGIGLLLAVFNPYLLVCVWIRGAWPEALAIAMVWLLVLGLWRLWQDDLRRGFVIATIAFAGIFLSHHPTALLVLYGGLPIAVVLILRRAWRALDAIYRCGREARDCRAFDAPEPLRDGFGELRYLGQLDSDFGPWVDARGGIWRTDVYDYLPQGLLFETWARTERDRRHMPPFPARAEVRIEPPTAARVLGERRDTSRWVVDLDVTAPAVITLERLRFAGWDLRVGGDSAGYRRVEPDADSIYYRFTLEPGQHRVKRRQVGTTAEQAGEWVSVAAWFGLFFWLGWSGRRGTRPHRAKEATA